MSIFHSRLFTFIVGDNAAPITVHSGAVAAVSGPLKELMDEENGQKSSAILAGVREEDFVRFCDYIYMSDYSSPYPVVVKSSNNASPNASSTGSMTNVTMSDQNNKENDNNENPKSGQPAFKRARTEAPITPAKPLLSFGRPSAINTLATSGDISSMNKARLAAVFEKYPGSKLGRTFGSNNSTGKINQPNEDHTNVFIAHAAMFAFADRFQVSGLKVLSLGKLKERLARLELFPGRVGDVTKLVRHVYQEENNGNGAEKNGNELKDLVSRYVASEIGIMGNSEEFCGLLEEGGCFVKDFWALIYGNLISGGSQIFSSEVVGKE